MRRSGFFFALVLVFSIPFWVLGARTSQLLPTGLPINIPISAVMAVCPLLAASVLVAREAGAAGVWRLVRRAGDPRGIRPAFWYVPILGLMPLIFVTAYGVMRLMGQTLPSFEVPLLSVAPLTLLFAVGALGEEAGWMGYAFEPLRARWGALGAGLIIGTVWGLWHVVPYLQAQHPFSWIAGQVVFTVSVRVLMAWLYCNTGRSVFAAIVVHTVINLGYSYFPRYGSHYDPVVIGALTALVAVVVALLWDPATLTRFRFRRVSREARAALSEGR